MNGGDKMVFGNSPFLEKFFHQLVFALGHQFHQRLVRLLGFFCQLRGDGTFFALAAAAHLVGVGLHVDQIHHAAQALLLADGQLHGHYLASEGSLQRLQNSFGAGAVAIHARGHDDARQLEFFKKDGKQVYTPDQNAFRSFAQKRYVEKYGNDWPKGALERINAIK